MNIFGWQPNRCCFGGTSQVCPTPYWFWAAVVLAVVIHHKKK